MQYTDSGQEALQTIPLSEFNNLSGVYVIPKTIEAKDDIDKLVSSLHEAKEFFSEFR